ncbi:MAG: hypothetical protein JNL90_03550 [Planctomycetes bacterium]|nr:hypothetical protein [Planctomycetota bacterium]
MRYTLSPKLHLSRLPLPTRILLSAFLVTLQAALAVSALKYTDRAEFTPDGARSYWHGEAPAADELLPGEAEIDDAPTAAARAPALRKSTRYLVDVVHPHLFTVPLVLFVLLHLLILTRLGDRAKIALTLHAFGSCAATFGLPFLVAASGTGALAFVVAGANLLLSMGGVALLLLVELWRAPPAGPARDALQDSDSST